MKFTMREVVFILLLMVIPVESWWLDFRPHNIANAAVRKEIDLKRKRLQTVNHVTGTIGNLKKEIGNLEQTISYFQAKLPNEKEIDKVLQEVWRLAEANRLVAKSIRTLKKTQRSAVSRTVPHSEQPIAMELQGDFIGFYSFLLAMENQPRIMRVRKIEMEKLSCAQEGQIKAELIMSIFFEGNNKD